MAPPEFTEALRIERLGPLTRRDFLKTASCAAAASLIPTSIAKVGTDLPSESNSEKLTSGWEYFQGSLGGPWDIWRNDMQETTIWKQVEVPHCFNARDAVDPDLPYYEGPGWYRRLLQLRNPFENGRVLVLFEGAGQKCKVFVATEGVGAHAGGYDQFVVDITDAAAKFAKVSADGGKEVQFAVLCDNSRDLEMIPSDLNDFHRFGGLYRNVSLIYVPAISLDRVLVDVSMSGSASAQLSVKGRFRNPLLLRDEIHFQLRLMDPQGSAVGTVEKRVSPWDGEKEIATFRLENPKLWSPSQPSLYRCEVQMASAHGSLSVTERFGCRYFEFVDHGLFKLNGEKLFLRGTQREEDHAGFGAAMHEDLIRQEMTLIKDMGANFIGLGHHQQSRTVLDLCDELGLLVLEEIPWSRGGLGDERYRQQTRDMLRNLIDQHYNHPSVILWGLGNENDWQGDFPDFDKAAIRNFVTELNDLAHQLDPKRKTFLRRCDFAKDLVDVYSPSLWACWYHGPYTQYRDKAEHEMNAVPHFLHVEWGAESHASRHSEQLDQLLANFLAGKFKESEREYLLTGGQIIASREGDWSETYACNLFDWHLKEQENMPQLAGSAQWIFKDFSTPLRPENPIPHVNQKGLMERDLTPKEGYYVFQSYWSEKPMIHIYGHSWTIRWGKPDELKLVKVYSNCETADLFLNGVSQGVRKRNPQEFPAAGLHWLVKFKLGQNHLKAIGNRKGTSVEDEVILEYQLDDWGPAEHLELSEVSREGETVHVQAQLVDANGKRCLSARDRVRFGLTGDGVLLDNLGTKNGSRIVELCNGWTGISLLRNKGRSVVSAHIQSVPTAFLTVS